MNGPAGEDLHDDDDEPPGHNAAANDVGDEFEPGGREHSLVEEENGELDGRYGGSISD